jgi:hypothetical protein
MCYWEHLGEHMWEHLGTHRKQGEKKNSSHPTPKRKKQGPSRVHVKPLHWLHEISLSKTICHCFWQG